MRARAAPAGAFLMLAACGYVGEPLPPSLGIPRAVADLTARQVGSKVVVRLTLPGSTTDGVAIQRLAEVELRAGVPNGTRVDEWAQIAPVVPVAPREPGPVLLELPAATWAGRRIELAVRVASLKRRWSAWSEPAMVDVIAGLEAPAAVRAESDPAGVRLRWQAAGLVRIWRKGPGQESFVEAAKVEIAEWIDRDARYEQAYAYQLQTLIGEAESDRSVAVAITPMDVFPPSPPAALQAVMGINSIELAWDRSPERDVAGYRVWRSEDGGDWKRVGADLAGASLSDRNVRSGAGYRYAVSAVDQKGNESARSAAVEIRAP